MLNPQTCDFQYLGERQTIAAEKLGRDWIGIDVTQLAISLIKNCLQDPYGIQMKFISSRSRRKEAHSSYSAEDQSGLTSAATEKGVFLVRIINDSRITLSSTAGAW